MPSSAPFNSAAANPPKPGELAHAAEAGDIGKIADLLHRGANPDDTYFDGITPLMYLAPHGDVAAMQMLLDAGAKVNAQSDGGKYTALITAVAWNQEAAVDLLLSRGADVTLKDAQGLTAIGWAAHNPALQQKLVIEKWSGPAAPNPKP